MYIIIDSLIHPYVKLFLMVVFRALCQSGIHSNEELALERQGPTRSRRHMNKEGKFIKKFWCCVGGRV